jgi:hypothetical protein
MYETSAVIAPRDRSEMALIITSSFIPMGYLTLVFALSAFSKPASNPGIFSIPNNGTIYGKKAI